MVPSPDAMARLASPGRLATSPAPRGASTSAVAATVSVRKLASPKKRKSGGPKGETVVQRRRREKAEAAEKEEARRQRAALAKKKVPPRSMPVALTVVQRRRAAAAAAAAAAVPAVPVVPEPEPEPEPQLEPEPEPERAAVSAEQAHVMDDVKDDPLALRALESDPDLDVSASMQASERSHDQFVQNAARWETTAAQLDADIDDLAAAAAGATAESVTTAAAAAPAPGAPEPVLSEGVPPAAAADTECDASLEEEPVRGRMDVPTKAARDTMFAAMDYNGNGALSLAEIDKAIVTSYTEYNHKAALQRAYRAADTSEDGLIERKEFRKLLHYLVYFNNMWEKFEAIDADGDKRLSLEEFTDGIASLGIADVSELDVQAEFESVSEAGGHVLFGEFCTWSARRHVRSELLDGADEVARVVTTSSTAPAQTEAGQPEQPDGGEGQQDEAAAEGDGDGGGGGAHLQVVVPEGSAPGDTMLITTPRGRELEVEVPAGVGPGQTFSTIAPPDEEEEQEVVVEEDGPPDEEEQEVVVEEDGEAEAEAAVEGETSSDEEPI
eukprot:COSAG01_NODE_7801_length_3051_cov_2.077210_2_plen_554_part_00